MRPMVKKWAGRLLRPAVALAAALAVLRVFPGDWTPALPAAASPWVAVCAALAARGAGILVWAALPLLLLAAWRGRWFCRAVCPVGWLQRLAEWRRPVRGGWLRRCPRWGNGSCWPAWAAPWRDFPFCWPGTAGVVYGFCSAWLSAAVLHDWRNHGGLPALLLLAWMIPRLWCARLLPLKPG